MKSHEFLFVLPLTMRAVTVVALLSVISSGAWAQEPPRVPTPAVPETTPTTPSVAPIPDLGSQTQPNAPTPATPLPTKTPDTTRLGIAPKDIKPTTRFDFATKTPGQKQSDDPNTITTLDQAISVAYAHNPSLLIAFERAVKTNATIAQILGGRGPQISGTGTYTRLFNSGSSAAGGSAGLSPSQIQNPFAIGLQNTPPGVSPATLSSGTTAATNTVSSTSSSSATTASTATRAESLPGSRQTDTGRQATSQDPGTTNPGNNPGGTQTTPQTVNNFSVSRPDLDQGSARIAITQFIDITGILKTAQEVGDLEQALNRLEIARLRQQTTLDVKNGYYSVLRTAAFVRVNEAAVAQSEELLRVTQAQLKAGVASAFDVLRAQTQLDNNRQALIQSRNQLLIAKNSFANTLGIDPSTPVDLADIPEIPALPSLDEEILITQALNQRPEYYQADTNILKATKNVRLARRNLEPYMNASVSESYSFNKPTQSSYRATGSAGLTLSIPLWDGGSTREAIKAARSDERQSLIQKDQFVRGIKAEVQQAIIAVKDAYERQTTTQGTVDQAREALRLANVRYKAGVGTQLEINDSQTALTQAETNQVNARYDYLAALARLNRAIGSPA